MASRARSCGLLAALMIAVTASAAPPQTGSELADACRDARSPGPCVNTLLNIADGHESFAAWGALPRRWCMPDIGYATMRDTYLAFVTAHPEIGAQPVGEAVAAAFAAAYPCPSQPGADE